MTAIVAASPIVRLVLPPADGRAYVVSLPESLADGLRQRYEEMAADHERLGFKCLSFNEWLEQRLTDIAYGDGRPHPAEAR